MKFYQISHLNQLKNWIYSFLLMARKLNSRKLNKIINKVYFFTIRKPSKVLFETTALGRNRILALPKEGPMLKPKIWIYKIYLKFSKLPVFAVFSKKLILFSKIISLGCAVLFKSTRFWRYMIVSSTSFLKKMISP